MVANWLYSSKQPDGHAHKGQGGYSKEQPGYTKGQAVAEQKRPAVYTTSEVLPVISDLLLEAPTNNVQYVC